MRTGITSSWLRRELPVVGRQSSVVSNLWPGEFGPPQAALTPPRRPAGGDSAVRETDPSPPLRRRPSLMRRGWGRWGTLVGIAVEGVAARGYGARVVAGWVVK